MCELFPFSTLYLLVVFSFPYNVNMQGIPYLKEWGVLREAKIDLIKQDC